MKYGTRRNRVIDYLKEIPFEKRPALGFYDTASEKPDFSATDFKRLRMDQVDEKRRDEAENSERKKDKKVLKQRKENDIPEELMNNEEPARKRSKLVLPAPQISDGELEQIVKLVDDVKLRHPTLAPRIVSSSSLSSTFRFQVEPQRDSCF